MDVSRPSGRITGRDGVLGGYGLVIEEGRKAEVLRKGHRWD